MKTFLLGTHQPHWLGDERIPKDVDLYISVRRLVGYKKLPVARGWWGQDSGGFSELSLYNEWQTTPAEYVASTRRNSAEIGNLSWAAPQDWMCEPFMVAKTGLSVAEHQRRTVANFIELQDLWGDDSSPFMPVLQGWVRDDYLRCIDMYAAAGVDLTKYPVVGLGSVCRRQATDEIGNIVTTLLDAVPGLPLHGFGVKSAGLEKYGHLLNTADSMAWSFTARRLQRPALPECVEAGRHINCANCIPYALQWRENVLASMRAAELRAEQKHQQAALFVPARAAA